ncbi:MAG: copper resistance protein NlpE [Bacteroides sp.]
MKKILILVCSCALISACGHNSKSNNSSNVDSTEVVDMHNAENSLDYQGTYKGTLPAADCPGIETTLTLNKDNSFTLQSVYIDRKTTFDEKGTYAIIDNIITATTDDGETKYYKVGENHLKMLNADKEEVTGELAESYTLKKEM